MSVWEFDNALAGWVAAHTSETGMTAAEQDDIWQWMQEKDGH